MSCASAVEVKSLGVRPRLQEPEYLAINPAGTLAALIDGDRVLYESLAICEYLAARHGSDLVVAPDEPERPEFQQWLLYGEATLQAPISAMARIGRIPNKTPEMRAGIDAGRCRHLGRLSAFRHRKARLRLAARPAVRRYRKRLLARPAFLRAAVP